MQRQLLMAGLLALAVTTAQADFNDGVVALLGGKYEVALKIFVPLAETSDHAYAQYFLGRMYENGQGVTKELKTAATWYRKAAEKGVGDAQLRLGALYERGEGLPRDMEYAYAWYSVAAHVGNVGGSKAMAHAKSELSPQELIEADKLARDLVTKYGVTPTTTARSQ